MLCTGPHLYTGLSSRFESRFSFSRPPPLGVFVCLSPSLWVVLLFTIFDRLSLVLGVDPIFALAPFSGLDHLKMNIFWLLPSPFSLTHAQKQDRRISSVVVHNARLFSVCSVCVNLSPPFHSSFIQLRPLRFLGCYSPCISWPRDSNVTLCFRIFCLTRPVCCMLLCVCLGPGPHLVSSLVFRFPARLPSEFLSV